jgi:hypothetical protein
VFAEEDEKLASSGGTKAGAGVVTRSMPRKISKYYI